MAMSLARGLLSNATIHDSDALQDSGDECGFEVQVEEGAEPVQRYTSGLFYPICIGDVLDDRY